MEKGSSLYVVWVHHVSGTCFLLLSLVAIQTVDTLIRRNARVPRLVFLLSTTRLTTLTAHPHQQPVILPCLLHPLISWTHSPVAGNHFLMKIVQLSSLRFLSSWRSLYVSLSLVAFYGAGVYGV